MLGYPVPLTGVARDLFDRLADGKDPSVKRFAAALPRDLLDAINCAWSNLPPGDKRRFGRPDTAARGASFDDALATYTVRQQTTARAAAEKQRGLYRDFERAHLLPGTAMRVAPDLATLRDFKLVFDRANNACCDPDPADPPTTPRRRVGVRLTYLQCLDETGSTSWGSDEISLLCVIVDGNAKVTTTQTREYSMDDGDKQTLGTIIYGPADPQGFLDIAISMVEHDKTDPKVGQTISSIGDALTKIPATKSAGIALEIIGGILSLISILSEDDFMGTKTVTWTGDIATRNAGAHIFSYYESDDYHYRVGFDSFALD